MTCAVGFAARLLGGFVFGQFGDKHGPRKLLLVGVATYLMGCLPSFAPFGYLALASLVVVLIGDYFRAKVGDAPIFVAARRRVGEFERRCYHGLLEELKRYPRMCYFR